MKIFSECHRRERDGSSEADRRRNKSGHEADGRMINLGKKMIFAAGPRQCRAQLAITKRAAKRGDSADDPKHQERKTRLDIGNLKSKASENAGADNVRNHDPAGGEKADRASRRSRIGCRWSGVLVHVGSTMAFARLIRELLYDLYCQRRPPTPS